MRILHTADWHLGQHFLSQERIPEQQLALEWLKETIIEQEIDAIIVAGDIFDVANPPNVARQLYYRFLTSLLGTTCRHIIIIGGNHDSPPMLDAPKDLLHTLNVHVLGCITGDLEDQILKLQNEAGDFELIVGMVPFLRSRDIRQAIVGESVSERLNNIQQGIRSHYEALAAILEPYRGKGVPIVTTGHLYATGALASAKQDNIYVGNIENIDAAAFPDIFDYVALGHLHRAQSVGDREEIRYAGSMIPLSFSEVKDKKSVCVIHFHENGKRDIEKIAIPSFREMKMLEGDVEAIRDQIQTLIKSSKEGLSTWLEILVNQGDYLPGFDVEIKTMIAGHPLEIMKFRTSSNRRTLAEAEDFIDLHQLEEPLEVFRQKCVSDGISETDSKTLESTFRELLEDIKSS